MAIVKANYVKRGKGERGRAKATIRYNQHRRGQDGATITRTLFGSDGAMDRYEAYRMIDEAKRGSIYYRFVISPDPAREDQRHDLDMREITMRTLQALEERVRQPILWVGALHDDHAPHRHTHVVAVVPQRLYVKDFELLRKEATRACGQQRRLLDLGRYRERERPYQAPSLPRNPAYTTPRRQYRQSHVSGGSLPAPLRTCTCPRCQTVHVHTLRDPVHRCSSCGLILHRQKQLTLTLQRKEAGWQR